MNIHRFICNYLAFIDEYDLDPKSVHCSHGGSMLLMGLREATSDIDLTVTQEVWDQFPEETYPVKHLGDGMCLKSITDKIDIHLADKPVSEDELDDIAGIIYYRNAERTLADKRSLNREKDLPDIMILEEFIAKKK